MSPSLSPPVVVKTVHPLFNSAGGFGGGGGGSWHGSAGGGYSGGGCGYGLFNPSFLSLGGGGGSYVHGIDRFWVTGGNNLNVEGFVRITMIPQNSSTPPTTTFGNCGQIGRTGPTQSMCSPHHYTADMLNVAKGVSSAVPGAQIAEVQLEQTLISWLEFSLFLINCIHFRFKQMAGT